MFLSISSIFQLTQIIFVGGDKRADQLKSMEAEDVIAYKEALTELVKAVSVAQALGKRPEDFDS